MVCASCGRHIALVQHIVSVGRREFAERVMGVVVVKEKNYTQVCDCNEEICSALLLGIGIGIGIGEVRKIGSPSKVLQSASLLLAPKNHSCRSPDSC
jgi:hypothetical protein